MPTRPRHHLDNTFASNAALTVRVDSLTESVSKLSAKMDMTATAEDVHNLAVKIDRLSQPQSPQYTTWIAAGALIITVTSSIFLLGVSPIKSDIDRIEKTVHHFNKDATTELKELRASIVPRGEHEQRWATANVSTLNIQRQIDEINKRTGEVYTARDIIIDLRQDVKALKDRAITNGK